MLKIVVVHNHASLKDGCNTCPQIHEVSGKHHIVKTIPGNHHLCGLCHSKDQQHEHSKLKCKWIK